MMLIPVKTFENQLSYSSWCIDTHTLQSLSLFGVLIVLVVVYIAFIVLIPVWASLGRCE